MHSFSFSPQFCPKITSSPPQPQRKTSNAQLGKHSAMLTLLLLVTGALSASEALSPPSYRGTPKKGWGVAGGGAAGTAPLNNNNNRMTAANAGSVMLNEEYDLCFSSSTTTEASKASSSNGAQQKTIKNSNRLDRIVDVNYVADTKLPTEIGHFRLRAYRVVQDDFFSKGVDCGGDNQDDNDVSLPGCNYQNTNSLEPVVIYHGDHPPFGTDGKLAKDIPIRIHDQCLTSEVFGSQRCDCSDQLKLSMKYIREHGGAVIYMQQEGRGIGLANKVAAYELQDLGSDTVDANLLLGFPADCRQYGAVPSILQHMQIGSIQLLTNNPRKVERLERLGVEITRTVPVLVPSVNEHNRKYMETKQSRMHHTNFDDLLLRSSSSSLKNNGFMTPKRATLPIIIDDATTNTFAEKDSLLTEEHSILVVEDEKKSSEGQQQQQEGVTAADDGYCFGRQSVEDAIAAISRGEMVVVVDDMDRENEGDFIMAADACTPEAMSTIVRYSSGVVCVAMEGDQMNRLGLPPMLSNNEDPKGTAFSVTVDASMGITTGISATDRSRTVQLLANPKSVLGDFNRPGHLFPLRAREGGVLARDGHTEATVDLSRLAGRGSCGVLCEIVSEDSPTEMMRLPEIKRFCQRDGYVLTSIVDLAQYRRDTEEEQ